MGKREAPGARGALGLPVVADPFAMTPALARRCGLGHLRGAVQKAALGIALAERRMAARGSLEDLRIVDQELHSRLCRQFALWEEATGAYSREYIWRHGLALERGFLLAAAVLEASRA